MRFRSLLRLILGGARCLLKQISVDQCQYLLLDVFVGNMTVVASFLIHQWKCFEITKAWNRWQKRGIEWNWKAAMNTLRFDAMHRYANSACFETLEIIVNTLRFNAMYRYANNAKITMRSFHLEWASKKCFIVYCINDDRFFLLLDCHNV